MNARVQITMDEEMLRRAQAKAAEQGITLAEYLRRLTAADLGPAKAEQKQKADISEIFDLGASGERTDIAKDKDRLIGEAVWQNYLRKMGRNS